MEGINLNETIDTNDTNNEKIESADFSERFLAYVIDTLPFVLLNYFTYDMAVKQNIIEGSNTLLNLWKVVWISIFILYEIILTSGGRVTIGKYFLGIKVISNDGGDLSFFKAFIRVLGYFFDSIIFNIGYIIALFTKENKALHDYFASSRVIKTRERSSLSDIFVYVLSWGLMAYFVGSWINKVVLKKSPYEEKQITMARRTIGKFAKLEEIHFKKYGFYTDDIRRLADLTHNIQAVRNEINNNLKENSLEISTNGKKYIISAKAKNWRKTKVEISNLENQ